MKSVFMALSLLFLTGCVHVDTFIRFGGECRPATNHIEEKDENLHNRAMLGA